MGYKRERPYHPFPTWQRRIRSVVDRIVETRQARWGHVYVTFLYRQIYRAEEAIGPPAWKRISDRTRQQERTRTAVAELMRSNPSWTVRQVAECLDITPRTAHRYIREARG